jgi:predicted ATPase
MFTQWRMKNFKSIEDLDLSLGQVNVFAGANSSGKSTILQSILLLKQTVQYAPPARSLALNGPILKLGSFSDVHNAFCKHDQSIGLGFSLKLDGLLGRGFSRVAMSQTRVSSVSANLKWIAPVANSSSHSDDASAALSPNLAEADYDVDREVESSKNSRFFTSLKKKKGDAASPAHSHQVTRIDEASLKELTSGKPDAELIGAATSHFLMSYVGVQYELTKQRSKRVAEAVCGGGDSFNEAPTYAPYMLVNIVRDWLSRIPGADFDAYFESLQPDFDDEIEVGDVVEAFRYLRRSVTASGNTEVASRLLDTSSLGVEIESRLIEEWGPHSTIDYAAPRALFEANDRIRTYFTSYIRYLGPLRDEPRHVYPLEALSQPDDVGYRGEHTAAVLELNSGTSVQYVPSNVFSRDADEWSSLERAPLRTAVIDWLTYVGVAVGFTAHDRGVFGHQLRVRTADGNEFHDLTNVGVGVSQVLPIIVGSLLAPRGSCLIFEQPELHLHPKVQARLADFFLALGFGGKQCLLETHSEYLVDRLRLRIAQASGDDVAKQVRIFFTEKAGGVTSCTPVEISNYGAALKWPKDFFDQSQREIESIVQAASAKRRAESKNARSAGTPDSGDK